MVRSQEPDFRAKNSMKLELINFRCYRHKIFHFEDGKVHYVEGTSGSGKSTIFAAIIWGLYGKLSDPGPRTEPNAQTMVIIEHNGYHIQRQRNPCLFRVITPTHFELWGDQAQEAIFAYYGQLETYMATSYICQDEWHSIFQFTPRQRLKLLNQIAFSGDNPRIIIDRFATKI
jgi:hypothetical protein